jgi:O-acetyl-ADP-ribose deacetylase (regulator of RNase III)
MEFIEEQNDLFNYEGKAWLAHCISADFALGAGIAVQFNKRYNLKQYLNKHHIKNNWVGKGYCIPASEFKVFNLVTKDKYNKKPTYRTLLEALMSMKLHAKTKNIDTIAMPIIGCGLDRLTWEHVKDIIIDVFSDTNIKIIICKL